MPRSLGGRQERRGEAVDGIDADRRATPVGRAVKWERGSVDRSAVRRCASAVVWVHVDRNATAQHGGREALGERRSVASWRQAELRSPHPRVRLRVAGEL